MTEFTAAHFAELCRQQPVEAQIQTTETIRKSALSRFWLILGGGVVAALVLAFVGGSVANTGVGGVLFVLALVGTAILAWSPLAKASAGIKHPALEALAAQGGMSFTPARFEPPVFAEARRPLFGSWLSDAHFSDLFYGQDEEGRRFAFYEATLSQGHGKHKTQVFSGQVYAFQRRARGRSEAVAVPDRGLFNFFKPAGGYQRLKLEREPEFEKKFEVYATDPEDAAMLFGSSALRALLLELRQSGRIFAYIGPEDVLVAATGRNRYEPGSMFRSHGGEQRVRLMFDDVCAALGILKRLKAVLD